MFFTNQKLEKRLEEIRFHMFRNRMPIEGWMMKEDETKQIKYPPAVDKTWQVIKAGDQWQGRDSYYWFQADFQVPNFSEEDRFAMIFDFGKTSLANLGGFESLLFIDGVPYQGVDTFHKETFLEFKEYSGKKITLSFKAWSGLEAGGPERVQQHVFKYADYALLDEATKDLYYLGHNLLGTILALGEDAPETAIYKRILNSALNKVDLSYPGSEEFYISTHLACTYLTNEVSKLPKNSPVKVDVVGHTHIDVAWLWRLKHTREKAARSFSTVLRLMDEYPEYIFLQTQPQIYEYIKEDYPDIYKKIQERVAEGRWEIDGAMWLEADCNIPSGEALVRQIMLGKKFISEEFNQQSKYLWLPDVFGYSWALPQILKKSGITTFMTTKISWNQYNQMPHDTFKWRGIDGTEILTHFITTPEPGRLGDPSFYTRYTYNGFLQPNIIKGIYDNYHDKELNQELLLAYGYGDGGGGVNRVMLENRRQMDKIAGLPEVKTSRADTYFEKLHETVEHSEDYVHLWDGELYLEYHRGTYTSQAKNKKYNRRLELLLRNAEIINTAKMLVGKAYPAKELTTNWKVLARNQFHDIIPGSSIKEVYEDSDKEYEESLRAVKQLISEEVAVDHHFIVTNTSSWERNEWVALPTEFAGYEITDEKGHQVQITRAQDKNYLYAENVAALSDKTYILKEAKESTSSETAINITSVETDFYTITWKETGEITSIFDKIVQREVVDQSASGNQFLLFEDKPLEFDSWDIDIFYNQKSKQLKAQNMKVLTANEHLVEVQFDYQFGESTLTQVMRLFKNSRRIDFVTKVYWQERQQLLKVAFPVNVRATEATYDIQYGNVKRPTHWNTSWDMAKFETVGHQWADISESNYGVSLLNDCKYGYDVKDNVMRLTLLKGAIFPNPEADMGEHEFTYSIFPHEGTVIESGAIQEAWQLNDPMLLGTSLILGENFIQLVGSETIAIDAIKQAENQKGIIVRLHEYSGGRQEISLKPQFEYTSVKETNLMEEIESEIVDLDHLQIKPFEVKTFYFEI
ncbi:alpha-mannosidase [Enterococcus sp. AZ194]|uniref:alpha-mannosidase n=1 Tax=Enterococcus sp. AZ194 TaxID=2774629 RepID=UPI003F20073A